MRASPILLAGCLAAAPAILSTEARAGVVDGSGFSAYSELIGLNELLPGLPVSVGVTNGGTVNYPNSGEVFDLGMAYTILDVDVAGLLTTDIVLGVLGVDWISADTFELVFDITPAITVDLPFPAADLNIPLSAGFDGTADWLIGGLDLQGGEVITGVSQIAGIDTGNTISWTDNSISIVSDNLLGIDLVGQRQTFQLTSAPVAPIPLPASAWLLMSGAGLMGALRLARRGRG
ncbi:hypothetical protein [Mangrovicoccus algicola]|uniref:VPLPA-CTERM sorting domain-containing protein n=1 Tax=Mangrovicoccus algicola TaxID=2771008 RepID=A0A8J7CIV0_9RHOB|nr:hypothetical protein [Mangrovicoccus algicola]MBE3636946.1 hypothetical protein [Mangrovicoccus algicola]